MRSAWLIARKDLSLRLRDKSAFLYGILAPFLLALIFSFVFRPMADSGFNARYVIVDNDGGQLAREFTRMVESLADEDVATVRKVATEAEARKQVEAGSDAFSASGLKKADAAFLIPEGFSAGVSSGRGGEMTVLGATGSQLAAQVAYSVAQGFASELKGVEIAVLTALPHGGSDPAQAGRIAQLAAQTKSPIALKDVTTKTRQLDQTTYTAAGMAVFFLFFTVSFGVSGLLEERRLGTMDRLLAAPIGRRSILLGKAISAFALGIISMTILVVATSLLLDAHWGNPLGVALLVVAAVFSAMGILAVVASVAKTADQAGSFQAIISLVLAFMGGTFFPVTQAGGLMNFLALLTPHAWFLRGLGDLQSGDVAAVFPAVGALLAFGLVTGGVAWAFLDRAVRR